MSNLREIRMRAYTAATNALKANDRATYDKAMADVDKLTADIQKEESRSATAADYPSYLKADKDRAFAFGKYLRGVEMTQTERRSLETRDVTEGVPLTSHIGSYSGLGFFVPTGFSYAVEQATKYFAPLLDVFRRLDTATGNPLPYPISNDTAQTAQLVGENIASTEQDGAGGNFGTNHVIFGAWKYTSGLVKCSLELLQDSAFDIESWLAERFGERFGRAYESVLTNGTGSSQPTGLLTAIATSGVALVIATGSSESTGGSQTGTNSIGYSDLVNLEHSVDPTYRRKAKYMFHDLTLSSIKRIIDKYGRPLWAPGITAGDPDRLNGYTYVINQSMPQIGAAANTVVFGDFSKFVVRKPKFDMAVQRLTERYAELGEVAFLALDRIDSNLLDAGTHPLNVLQQHS